MIERLIELRMTGNQYIFTYLVATSDYGNLQLLKQVNNVTIISKEELTDLISRKILKKTSTGYTLGESGESLHGKRTNEYAIEFYNKYPDYLDIKGKRTSLKVVDIMLFYRMYNEVIDYNISKHREMIEILEYGVDNELVNMSITNFLKSRQFDIIKKEMNEDGTESGIEEVNL